MIHYFNPGHETAVVNASPYYMAPANVVLMQRQLAYLPAWYAAPEDVVFVWEVDEAFHSCLRENLRPIASPIGATSLPDYAAEDVCLWGISPQAIHFWEELKAAYELDIHLPQWREEYRYLNSRQSAQEVLSLLCGQIAAIEDTILPVFTSSLDEVESMVEQSTIQLLAKAPYSSSGRGLLWLPVGELTRTERQILHGIIKKQQVVSIEQALDKQVDFAMEFLSDGKGKVSFAGYSLFYASSKGAYEGNYLGSQKKIAAYLSSYLSAELLERVQKELALILSDKYALYEGCIGVDMMLYKSGGEYRLHPCVEINMRYNMGYLAMCFSRNYLHPQSEGAFYLDYNAGEGSIMQKHNELQTTRPAIIEDGRLKSGYLPLCPVRDDSHYWAYVLVTADGGEIPHKR
ncbi:hypothetical protein [Dysgonomonas sp. 25]|uniref:hypothetical protein n=1 Tax=Dysgonomonas sp. 25 TaxID=2302933 RepID=UPI0013D568A7|nr:hypothetical protein [Dysgonomonas sp. 25]NDV69667.1 hypothetical protein [Dysgonomonas sp. 25]